MNFFGYGYTDAGRRHAYSITYENIGGVAANDVRIVDVLSTDLDDATLLVNDGGLYDPATRTIVWTDAVVPPADPRTVSFQVDVRADAEPGTRIRNSATIVFPDAAPPSRIDTNFVEHSIVDPAFPVIVDPGVIQCVPTGAGDQWMVSVFNKGFAYGFNASATIVNPPSPVQVTDGTVALGSMGDPAGIDSMVALGTTNGVDTVVFTTTTPGDPCRALTWRISYEEVPGGPVTTVDVQVDPDGDGDAVRDQDDNCPVDFNPTQADSNGNGIGDACDSISDSDNDNVVDELDLCPDTELGDPVDAVGCSDAQVDADGDGVCNMDAASTGPSMCTGIDMCPATVIPESVPTRKLRRNHWALTDGDLLFDTKHSRRSHIGSKKRGFTTADTAGCSCEQIIDAQGLGKGHRKFGCSNSAMKHWVWLVNQ